MQGREVTPTVAAAVKVAVWPAVNVWLAGCVVIIGGLVSEGALLMDSKDLVCRASAGVLLDMCARCCRGADDVQAPIAHVAG